MSSVFTENLRIYNAQQFIQSVSEVLMPDKEGKVKVVYAVYDLDTGVVEFIG